MFFKRSNYSRKYWSTQKFCSISCSKNGVIPSEYTKKLMSDAQKKIGNRPPIFFGKEHQNWKGGLETLKIRESEYFKKWYQENKKKMFEYAKNKRKTNIQFRIACNLRARLHQAVKRVSKRGSAVSDLGCSIQELKYYLEGKFSDRMDWNNYGRDGWHIDHIIPLTYFDLTNREQFLRAVNYKNLQPMWAKENISKGNRIKICSITL